MPAYNTPDLGRAGFARTNRQTIAQSAALIRDLLRVSGSSAELCCAVELHVCTTQTIRLKYWPLASLPQDHGYVVYGGNQSL